MNLNLLERLWPVESDGCGPISTAPKILQKHGVTGPDNDQDQTTTTLFGRSLVLKFQDQTTTT